MNKARLLFSLSVVGFLVSLYLVAKTADPSSVACSIGGGCETVLSSQYARLFGVSVATYGALWYLGIALIIYLSYFRSSLNRNILRLGLAAGLLFSLYLLGLEIFVIRAYCTWCLVSLGVVVAMTAVELFYKNNQITEAK